MKALTRSGTETLIYTVLVKVYFYSNPSVAFVPVSEVQMDLVDWQL
jgi:hypothetical protein